MDGAREGSNQPIPEGIQTGETKTGNEREKQLCTAQKIRTRRVLKLKKLLPTAACSSVRLHTHLA